MRIAFVGIKGLPARGGAERVVEAIVQRLRDRHDITVYCSQRYTASDARAPGVKLARVPCPAGKYSHMLTVNALAAWHAVLCGHYDLVHVHNIEACFVLPILKLRYKIVATAHGRITADSKWGRFPAALMRLMERPYALLSDAATSVSRAHADEFRARFGRTIAHIPNGVEAAPEVDLGGAGALLDRRQAPRRGYILFVGGRIIPLKGAHVILDAMRQMPGDLRLVIVGDLGHAAEYARRLEAAADARVTFVPFVESNAALLGLIQQSAVFVFPSTVEAMSITLLDAASVGAPVVCSDIPANVAVLQDNAVYFRSGDAGDLARKLQWALDHPREMQEQGARAQAWVRQTLAWDDIVDRYEQLYQHVCG